jgi:RNA recognition motif. (a.k.a. RRM, RBD, or RNP domain)
MIEAILNEQQVIEGSKIKVASYLDQSDLEKFVKVSMGCRIYIKKLPNVMTNEELHALFSVYGPVAKAYCVNGTKIRKNYKYGYVNFENEETVDKIPINGVFYQGIKIVWNCHKIKVQKKESTKLAANSGSSQASGS